MTFPESIKKIRKELLLSQEDLALDIGVGFSTINRWENGKAKPRSRTLKALSEYCKQHSIDISFAEMENDDEQHGNPD